MSVYPRYSATEKDLSNLIEKLRLPGYRAKQIYEALWSTRIALEAATNLPQSLKEILEERLPLSLDMTTEEVSADGLTRKWLWQSRKDAAQVETVLMEYPSRATVCVSSQAGCAMGCTFCATGQAGFERHLTRAEILEQVLRAAQSSNRRVSNVVFMGMGEPLANYDETWGAVERLHRDLGLSARHITVSTVGVVPGIRRLAAEEIPVTLAVSLHAPDDDLRSTMVPLNNRYPIAEILDAAAEFAASKGRRVTFEYACIADVNDTDYHANALAKRLIPLGSLGAHVNLIPLNPTEGFSTRGSSTVRILDFAARLRMLGITATIRRNRGTDIDGACGQLRSRVAIGPRPESDSTP
ncbi:23S rRNA m(2)A-2503 methyltransferase [Actinobacteria bacterium IMCC26256]|nr:23S rRNA m(2)A-2503 methyltransferase [Actinobacteria bacterium IMCC26256]